MKALLTLLSASLLWAVTAHGQTIGEKIKNGAKDAANTVARTTKNAANAVVETVNPDKDARRVEVNLGESSIDMPTTLQAGKTAFVVRNTATEKRDFTVRDEGMDRSFVFALAPNESKTLQTTLKRGKYKAYCIAKDEKERRFPVTLTVR